MLGLASLILSVGGVSTLQTRFAADYSASELLLGVLA